MSNKKEVETMSIEEVQDIERKIQLGEVDTLPNGKTVVEVQEANRKKFFQQETKLREDKDLINSSYKPEDMSKDLVVSVTPSGVIIARPEPVEEKGLDEGKKEAASKEPALINPANK